MADARQILQEVRQLNQALAESRMRVTELGNQSMYVQNSVSRALGQVRSQLRQLGNTLVPVANVGLNLLRKFLSLLQPVARGLASVVTTLFGVKLAGQAKEVDSISDAAGRATKAANGASKALNGTAKATRSVASATKAVKQAQLDLLSFDEINRLSPQTPDSDSASGGKTGDGSVPGSTASGGGLDIGSSGSSARKGIEVPVSQWAQKLKGVLADIWEPFQQAWRNRGEFVLNAARTGLEQVKNAAKAVGSTWLAVWRDGTGERIVGTVLTIAGELCQVVGNLAERFQIAWESCGTGERIVKAVFGILEDGLDWVEQLVSATVDWSKSLDLSPILGSVATLLEAFRNLAGVVENLLADAWREVLLPLAKWTIEKAAPELVHLLANAMNLLAGALRIVQPIGQAVWENFLQPLAKWTGDVAIVALHGLNTVLEKLGGLLNGIADIVGGSGTWTEKLRNIGGLLADSLKGGISQAVSGLGDWVKTHVSDKVLAGLGGLGRGMKGVFQSAYNGATDVWKGIGTAFSGFASKASGGMRSGFGGEVKKVFSNAYTAACSAWNGLGEKFKGFGNSASDGLKNSLKNDVRSTFANAYAAACDAWSGVGERFRSVASNAVSGVRNGLGSHIKDAFSSAYTAACNAWSGVGGRFKSFASSAVSGIKSGLGTHIRTAFASAYSAACSAWSGISSRFSGFASSAVNAIRNGFSWNSVTNALTTPFRTAFNAVIALANRVVGKINSALTFSWNAVQVGGVTLVQAGSAVLARLPGISYLAQGGVLTRPTPLVAGEAGAEAIVPLERNLGWLDKLAELLAEKVPGGGNDGVSRDGQPILVQCVLDGKVIASSTVDYINRRARATGVNPLSAYI